MTERRCNNWLDHINTLVEIYSLYCCAQEVSDHVPQISTGPGYGTVLTKVCCLQCGACESKHGEIKHSLHTVQEARVGHACKEDFNGRTFVKRIL